MFLFNKKRVMTNEERIVEYLKRAIPSSKINGNSVYLSEYRLTIEPHIRKIEDNSFAKVNVGITLYAFKEYIPA